MRIYLAGGCFWGVQAYFDLVEGVLDSQVGYANAHPHALQNHALQSPNQNPSQTLSYEMVCSGLSGAVEAVEIDFDEGILPLDSVFARFFSIINPTSLNRQGNDIGTQYRSGIYALDERILARAKEFIASKIAPQIALKASLRISPLRTPSLATPLQIATEVLPLANFTPAESYHQKYLAKNPNGYCHIDISRALEPL